MSIWKNKFENMFNFSKKEKSIEVKNKKEKSIEVKEKLWSILILTLESRKDDFEYIYNKLNSQIQNLNLIKDVEILYFSDNKENSVGYKRNELLSRSKSKYISFVDDDDDVSDFYVKYIYDLLLEDNDCVSLNGIITFEGRNPKKFIHSLKYNSYFEKDGIYYRPPNHLNTIKRELVEKIKFPDINKGEDTDWAMNICKSGLLKTESVLDKVVYYYKFSEKTTETQK